MAYGFLIQNENLRNIVDGNSTMFCITHSGDSRILQMTDAVDYEGAMITEESLTKLTFFNQIQLLTSQHFAASSLTAVGKVYDYSGSARISAFDTVPKFPVNSICFWRPGVLGISRMTTCHFAEDILPIIGTESYWLDKSFKAGRMFAAGSKRTTPIPWFVADEVSTYSGTETYGFKLFREDGSLSWDTRLIPATVEHMHMVTSAVILDVIENKQTHVFTIPVAVPNAYIHCPSWTSFYRERAAVNQYSDVTFPKLRQISPTSFEISPDTWVGRPDPQDPPANDRVTLVSNGAPGDGLYRGYAYDAPLFISRGPVGFV